MDHDLNYILIHILARPGTQSESTASTYRNSLRSIGVTDLDGLTKLLPSDIDTLRLKPAERNRIGALVAWFQYHPDEDKEWKKLTTSEFDSWCLRHARRTQKKRKKRSSRSRSRGRSRGRSRERGLLRKEVADNTSAAASDERTGISDRDLEQGICCCSCSDSHKHLVQKLIPAVILVSAVIGISIMFFRTVASPYNFILVGLWVGGLLLFCCWPGSPAADDESTRYTKQEYEQTSQHS